MRANRDLSTSGIQWIQHVAFNGLVWIDLRGNLLETTVLIPKYVKVSTSTVNVPFTQF
jgi:hypothetical protein